MLLLLPLRLAFQSCLFFSLLLLLAEVELNLVQIEIDKFDLLNHAVHHASTVLEYVLPELNHLPQSLSQSH